MINSYQDKKKLAKQAIQQQLLEKGLFYEDVPTFDINMLFQSIIEAKIKHGFETFYQDFAFVKGYHKIKRMVEQNKLKRTTVDKGSLTFNEDLEFAASYDSEDDEDDGTDDVKVKPKLSKLV